MSSERRLIKDLLIWPWVIAIRDNLEAFAETWKFSKKKGYKWYLLFVHVFQTINLVYFFWRRQDEIDVCSSGLEPDVGSRGRERGRDRREKCRDSENGRSSRRPSTASLHTQVRWNLSTIKCKPEYKIQSLLLSVYPIKEFRKSKWKAQTFKAEGASSSWTPANTGEQ